MFSLSENSGDVEMNQPPIPLEGLDPVIKRQLETSLHGQYEFAAKTVWMGWIFTLGAIAFGLYWAWFGIEQFVEGDTMEAVAALGGASVCGLIAYEMWASHQVQKKLSKQYQADMAARSAD